MTEQPNCRFPNCECNMNRPVGEYCEAWLEPGGFLDAQIRAKLYGNRAFRHEPDCPDCVFDREQADAAIVALFAVLDGDPTVRQLDAIAKALGIEGDAERASLRGLPGTSPAPRVVPLEQPRHELPH